MCIASSTTIRVMVIINLHHLHFFHLIIIIQIYVTMWWIFVPVWQIISLTSLSLSSSDRVLLSIGSMAVVICVGEMEPIRPAQFGVVEAQVTSDANCEELSNLWTIIFLTLWHISAHTLSLLTIRIHSHVRYAIGSEYVVMYGPQQTTVFS